MTSTGQPQRKLTRVAVGVLVRSDGLVLLADRPAGKPYAGYWEFPGGKIEPGEDVAAALERELHEELGVEIGQSTPWVTFDFDYPHAYVELQFRLVDQWRGGPHPREGQRLGFFDPAGTLPQPLLPAAVPALRWLRLPRTILVTGLQGQAALDAGAAASKPVGRRDAPPIIVVDADWRIAGSQAAFDRLPVAAAARGRTLLASGPGALAISGASGVVHEAVDVAEVAEAGRPTDALRAAWVDSVDDLRLALRGGCDFVLARSASLAEASPGRAHPLPVYLPRRDGSAAVAPSAQCAALWHWLDLRLDNEAEA